MFVPPSGGSLEIGNLEQAKVQWENLLRSSPFGGIPRNWKLIELHTTHLVNGYLFPLRGDP